VRSPQVLAAMKKVRREGYVPSYLGEFAYDDTPLPIEEEMEGFREYEHLRTTARYEWFPVVEGRVIAKWTRRGNTDWAMVAYLLKGEIDAYLDVEYAVRSGTFQSGQVQSCNERWASTDSAWSMTLHCLKNSHRVDAPVTPRNG
jgi:hypothetical protein